MLGEGWVALACASWFVNSSDAVKYSFISVADDVPKVVPGLAWLHAAVNAIPLVVSFCHESTFSSRFFKVVSFSLNSTLSQ